VENFTLKDLDNGLVKANCMHEAFDFRETLSLCASKFNSKLKLVLFISQGKNHVLPTPNIFRRRIQLPTRIKSSRFWNLIPF
jgi:hypothetical protein